jgi:hypothetical protein
MQFFLEQGKTLLEHLASAARTKKATEQRLVSASFHACLEVAKALTDVDKLEQLM